MMLKLMTLALPPLLVLEQGRGLAEHAAGRLLVDVAVRGERGDEVRVARQVGQHAELDLRIVGRQEARALSPGRTPGGTAARSRPRVGMFCRLGSELDSRPVEADRLVVRGVDAAGLRDR